MLIIVVLAEDDLHKTEHKPAYYFNLNDLKKLDEFRVPYIYNKINENIGSRKTLTGGLKIQKR